jgi:hypothetical protein
VRDGCRGSDLGRGIRHGGHSRDGPWQGRELAWWPGGKSAVPLPVPPTSHVEGGFPILLVPARFTSRAMGPIRTGRSPRRTVDGPLNTVVACCPAIFVIATRMFGYR